MPYITQTQRNQTRQKILQSTYRLFVQMGDKLTTQMICEDARVSKGTLFNYFESKDLLLHTAFVEAEEHVMAMAREKIDMDQDEKQIIRGLLCNSCQWAIDFPEEVIYSERYNDMTHSDLTSADFRNNCRGMLDIGDLPQRLLARIENPAVRSYAMIAASIQAFYFCVYVANHPEAGTDEALLSHMADVIWHIFE